MNSELLYQKINESDFLVSDSYTTHRLVGLKYDFKTMLAPKISLICTRQDMVLAKYYAFSLNKWIVVNSDYSARLFRKYSNNETLAYEDYFEAINYYSKFFIKNNINL